MPEEQQVAPVKPCPPHWPQRAAQLPAGFVAAGLVAVARVVGFAAAAVVGAASLIGVEPDEAPPDEAPPDQTAGPGMGKALRPL